MSQNSWMCSGIFSVLALTDLPKTSGITKSFSSTFLKKNWYMQSIFTEPLLLVFAFFQSKKYKLKIAENLKSDKEIKKLFVMFLETF